MNRFVLLAGSAALLGCGGGSGPSVPVASLTVTPAGPVLDTLFSKGETVQLNVTAKDEDGATIPGARITYSSSNMSIATVSNTGRITAENNGTAIVTAASGGVSEQRTVWVRQKLNGLLVAPTSFTLALGGNRTLSVSPIDARSNLITGLSGTTFETQNAAVATVSASGVVSAQSLGNTMITASLTTADGTRTANSTVNVVTAFPNTGTIGMTASNFSPNEVDISAGGTVTFTNTAATSHNVTFAAGGPANIGNHTSGSNQRTFPTAGTFEFECTNHAGMAGRVIVH